MSLETFLEAELDEVRRENRKLVHDVHVHKSFEQQLRNEVSRLRSIIATIPAPLPNDTWNHEATDAATWAWLSAYRKWYVERPRSAPSDGTGRKAGW